MQKRCLGGALAAELATEVGTSAKRKRGCFQRNMARSTTVFGEIPLSQLGVGHRKGSRPLLQA